MLDMTSDFLRMAWYPDNVAPCLRSHLTLVGDRLSHLRLTEIGVLPSISPVEQGGRYYSSFSRVSRCTRTDLQHNKCSRNPS